MTPGAYHACELISNGSTYWFLACVSYQAILNHTEPAMKFEMAWAMPFWFGKILDSLQK